MPSSNFNTILERLAAIQMLIPGIVNAYAYEPADPSSAECPFFINEPAINLANSSDFLAQNLYRLGNTVDMWLCVARWEADATQAANFQNAYGWRDLPFTTFGQHLRLSLTPGVPDLSFIIDAHITAWSLGRHPIGTTDFVALGYRLSIRETLAVNVTS
jgi:hypothetical protein